MLPTTPAGYPPAVLYLSAGLVGFAFFLMELVWYRMLGPILGGSTFTFGLILAVALAGIGLGGALYPIVFQGRQPTLRAFALTLAWEALAIALPFALGDRLAILALVLRSLAVYGFLGQALGWLTIALIVVFPAALVSGIQFPLLVALIGQGNRDLGKQLGQAFGWNTVGAIAGSLAGGFGLVSLLSATGVWQGVVLLLALLAGAVLLADFHRVRRAGRLLLPLGVIGVAAICLAARGPTAVWRHSGIGAGRAPLASMTQNDLRAFENSIRRHIISQTDGRESSVALSTQHGLSFIVNGKSDGNAVTDAGTQMMLGVLGALLHPDPREGLVIGLGTGESAGWLASLPAIRRVDVVELEPAIQDVARQCGPLNHNVLDHSKVHLTLNDAREALQTTRRTYDLIASEPSNPYRTGVSSLYTREFYLAARGRLKPGGVFIQWLQGYEIDLPTIRTVLCTLSDVFPHIEIWETNPADLVLVCSVEPLNYSAADLRQRMAEPAMREALRVAWRTKTLEGVLAHLVADARYARAVAERGEAAINTDDRNVLEYSFARTVGRQGGFTITGLRAEATRAGLQRPERLQAQIDWERVEDCRIAQHYVVGESPLPPESFTGDRAKRARALAALIGQRDAAGMIRHWESQPKPPYDLAETLALALAYAELGDTRAAKLALDLRADAPLEALALEGSLAARQDQPALAAERLSRLFTALRSDATPTRRIIEHALLVASQLAEKHRDQVRPLYESLNQPFAVFLFEERRRGVLCRLGERLGGREFTAAMLALEPHPPWDKTILQMRVRAYSQTQHPLLARAQRDLDEIFRLSPEAAVLMPTEKAARESGSALAAPPSGTARAIP
jgi:spermidine synthase